MLIDSFRVTQMSVRQVMEQIRKDVLRTRRPCPNKGKLVVQRIPSGPKQLTKEGCDIERPNHGVVLLEPNLD